MPPTYAPHSPPQRLRLAAERYPSPIPSCFLPALQPSSRAGRVAPKVAPKKGRRGSNPRLSGAKEVSLCLLDAPALHWLADGREIFTACFTGKLRTRATIDRSTRHDSPRGTQKAN